MAYLFNTPRTKFLNKTLQYNKYLMMGNLILLKVNSLIMLFSIKSIINLKIKGLKNKGIRVTKTKSSLDKYLIKLYFLYMNDK